MSSDIALRQHILDELEWEPALDAAHMRLRPCHSEATGTPGGGRVRSSFRTWRSACGRPCRGSTR